MTEVWFTWKILASDREGEPSRFITPWGDPRQYERPYDFIFKTPQEARAYKAESAPDEEGWILTRMVLHEWTGEDT